MGKKIVKINWCQIAWVTQIHVFSAYACLTRQRRQGRGYARTIGRIGLAAIADMALLNLGCHAKK